MSIQIFFWIFGTVIAVSNCWKIGSEYAFEVNGRTLTGLKDVGSQYSGVIMKAKLLVYPQVNGNLMAKIKDCRYAQVHRNLTYWSSEIPDSSLHYLDLNISSQLFEIMTVDGVITNIIMEKNTENWEANIIKGIVSQLQLNTQGKNIIEDPINQLPVDGSNSAVFKTLEETITGAYETLYDISELPEYVLQSKPWLVSVPEEKSDSKVIEIVKSKNFDNAPERLSYYWGFGEIGEIEPNTNKMGDFFTKSSISHAIITGNLKKYTLQASSTTNTILISPTLNSKQNGMVVSYVSIVLMNIKMTNRNFDDYKHLEKIELLTYSYNPAFSSPNKTEDIRQDEVTLKEPLQSPLLPLFIGNKGENIKKSNKIDLVSLSVKISKKIANEIRNPENIPNNQTLSKYVILSTITRLMSEHEMENVTDGLYTENANSLQYLSWTVFRDAVAECGTGPALLTIKKWIKNKKINNEEAAEVISSMSQAVRQPTDAYMRSFYALVTKEVTTHPILNDTALLSYTDLIRKVYVDRIVSHNQFPVHGFGNFRTELGKRFVAEELIPYLDDKLNEAFKMNNRHQILIYIRALGNLGHQRILAAFEPYLEGEKSANKFQRLQMVIALDKLVKTYPIEAQSVLYKIYQNSGEDQEIRVAAVYQLMRTGPTDGMLKRMAKYTNIDTHQQVNSAVKTAITTAAKLKGKEFINLSLNARSAEHLLTQNTYGHHYSGDYLKSYMTEEMNLIYKQTIQVYGSKDSILPRGLKYALRTGLGGIRRQLLIVQVMVSSVDDLVNVFKTQTEDFKKENDEYENHSEEMKRSKFSSEAIEKMLGLEFIRGEPLEGSLFLQIFGSAARYFTFDNSTIGILPSVLREVEEILSDGYNINFIKLINRYELAIGFPTEMGLPFIYTMDMPTLLSLKGQIRATAEPKISSEDKLIIPQTITAYSQLHTVFSTKIEAKLGFITPFDHQEYLSGFDRNLQINLPIKAQMEFDIKTSQTHAQIQPLMNEKNTKIFHYTSLPYTAIKDILVLKPKNSDTKIIYFKEPGANNKYISAIGEQNGMVFNVDLCYSDYTLKESLRNESLGILIDSFYNQKLQYAHLYIDYNADESTTNKIQIKTSHNRKYSTDDDVGVRSDDFTKLSRNSEERKNQLVRMAGFKGTNVEIYEFSIEFDGKNKVAYAVSFARSDRSNDNKSKLILYMKKTSLIENESRPLEIGFWAKTYSPRTNRLNFIKSLSLNTSSEFEAELFIGKNLENPIKVIMKAKFDQTESYKKYLEHPRAQKCLNEMYEGNTALPNCAKMTLESNLLNHMKLNIRYENIASIFYDIFRLKYNFNLENGVEIETFINDELKAINMTIRNNDESYEVEDIQFKGLDKPTFVIHPDYSIWSRIKGDILNVDGFGESCIIDWNAVNTFDNKTYPLHVDSDKWVVLMHYTPQYVNVFNQIDDIHKNQFEQYSVLIRETGNKKRDVKVVLRNGLTSGKIVEVDMKHNLEVFNDGNKVANNTRNGLVKLYDLPFGEIKVTFGSEFSIVYDGIRVLIEDINDKFRESIRGLCGSFSEDVSDDFYTPKNCIVENPKDFVASYTLGSGSKEVNDCFYKNIVYANLISDTDIGRSRVNNNESNSESYEDDSCVKYQTKYVIEGDDICFTIHSLPACNGFCSMEKIIEKNTPVHCVKQSSITDIWKEKIQKGANLDFSRKSQSKSIKMKMPEVCSRY